MYPTKQLGDLIKITKGKKVNYSVEKGEYNYIDIGILRTGIIEQYTNDLGVKCNKSDILIAWDGSKSGTVGFGLDGIISSTLAKIELKEKNIDYEFLGKFLQSKFDYLNKNTSGAAIPHIRKDILTGLQIQLPPLPTQKLIVQKLDSAFENIDKNINLTKENLKNLEELNKSILEKAFSKGEYEMKKLGEISSILGDGLHGTPKYTEKGDYFFINGNNLDDGNIIFKDGTKKVDIIEYEKYKKILNSQTVFVSINGTIGNTSFYDNEKIILGKSVCYFNLNNDVSKFYVRYFIKSIYFIDYVNKEYTGTTIKNVSLRSMRHLSIPLPPFQKQKEIVSYLDQVFQKNKELKTKYELQLKELEELKQSLLKEAFEGRLVKE